MKKIIYNPVVRNGHNIVLTTASVLLIATLFYAAFFAGVVDNAKAGEMHNVSGWAWSDNIGWISFNSTNDHDENTFGVQESSIDYGVNVDVGDNLSGYAWSDNIGWITFNAGDISGCPSGSCEAKLNGNNLQGWARALSYGDDWDGWISLNGATYGVVKNGNDFENYAWDASKIDPDDDDEQAIGIGWINFNPSNGFGGVTITPPGGVIVNLSANPALISSGGNSVLTWSSSNATACEGIVGPSNWLGSKGLSESDGWDTGPITGETVYRIECTNATSGVTNDATVFIDLGGGGTPQCSDGIDNTDPEDTRKDINDPGCYNSGLCAYDPLDNNEINTLPLCSNCFDDDGDGKIDFPDDPGCSSPTDNSEFNTVFKEI